MTSICEIVDPEEALAPVTPPVVPAIVQLNVVPATLLVRATLVVLPLQIVVGLTVDTFGVGFTVIVNVCGAPVHVTEPLVKLGVTVMVAVTGVVPVFVAVKEAMFPVPVAGSPMPVAELVQL